MKILTLEQAKNQGLECHKYDLERYKFTDKYVIQHLIHNGEEVAQGSYVHSYDLNRYLYEDSDGIEHHIDLTKDNDNSISDGSTAKYYELPQGAEQLQDLISSKNMNAQIGEIFRTAFRFGEASHSDPIREIKKILFYANAELKRLESL
jgi:hypothetical protein